VPNVPLAAPVVIADPRIEVLLVAAQEVHGTSSTPRPTAGQLYPRGTK
jgi:hypothetical protein